MLFLERDAVPPEALAMARRTPTHGGGSVVLVTGEAGIGKTSLVREFLRRRGKAPFACCGERAIRCRHRNRSARCAM